MNQTKKKGEGFKREATDAELCCMLCGQGKSIYDFDCKECGESSIAITKLHFRKNVTEFIELQDAKRN